MNSDNQCKISKSNFIKGKQCLKALYLNKKHYHLRDKISEEQQKLFNHGHKVGELAHQLFPGGAMAAFDLPAGFMRSINKTKDLIKQGETVIYEAGLMYKNAHCFVDILVKEKDKWKIFEVKSSGSISEVHIYDAAFQYYILNNLGFDIGDVFVVYVNKEYKQKQNINVQKYFIIESVFKRIKELQPYIEKQLQAETEILQKTEIPEIEKGEHCTKPYKCDFIGYC